MTVSGLTMALDPNQVIADSYRIIEKIGSGGMGTVYRGMQLRLNREVAIKVLSEEATTDESMVKRFVQEAHVIARLNHPRIVTIYDVLPNLGGRHFMVMEFVKGVNLEDFKTVRGGQLPLGEVCKIGAQVCEGLACAHAQGIIHRDIKPGNVMMLPSGDIKLMDFGIARLTRDSNIKTETGRAIGTPLFMSPEQIMAKDIDHRADIYSLGAMLYNLATGQPPFFHKSPIMVARSHLTETVQPARALNPRIPEVLDVVLMRCLQKEPGKRYQNADALRVPLDEIAKAFLAAEGQSSKASTVSGPGLPSPVAGSSSPKPSAAESKTEMGGIAGALAGAEQTPLMESSRVHDTPPSGVPADALAAAFSDLAAGSKIPAAGAGSSVPQPAFVPPSNLPKSNLDYAASRPGEESVRRNPMGGTGIVQRVQEDSGDVMKAFLSSRPSTGPKPIAPSFGKVEGGDGMKSLMDVSYIPHKVDAAAVLEEDRKGWLVLFWERCQMGRLTTMEAITIGFLLPGLIQSLTHPKRKMRRVGMFILWTSFAIFLLPLGLFGMYIYRVWFSIRSAMEANDRRSVPELISHWVNTNGGTTMSMLAGFVFFGWITLNVSMEYQREELMRTKEERRIEALRNAPPKINVAPTPGPTPEPTDTPVPRITPQRTPEPTATPRTVSTPTPRPVATQRELIAGPVNVPKFTPKPEATPFVVPVGGTPAPDSPTPTPSSLTAFLPTPPPSTVKTPEPPPTPTPLPPLAIRPSKDNAQLIQEVLEFRNRRAYSEPNFEEFVKELGRQHKAGYADASLTMAYLVADLAEQNPALYQNWVRQPMSLPVLNNLMPQLERNANYTNTTVIAAARMASKKTNRDVTDKLRNVTFTQLQSASLQELFAQNESNMASDPYQATVSLTLKSNDPAMAPFLIRSLRSTDGTYYSRVFSWLKTNGNKSHAALLGEIKAAGPGARMGDWDQQMDATMKAISAR